MLENKKADLIIEGWLGGDFDHLGMFKNKKDAERGYMPDERLYNLLDPVKEKRVRITVEIIEG